MHIFIYIYIYLLFDIISNAIAYIITILYNARSWVYVDDDWPRISLRTLALIVCSLDFNVYFVFNTVGSSKHLHIINLV